MEPQKTDENLTEQNPFLISDTIPARDNENVKSDLDVIGIPQYHEPEVYAGNFGEFDIWLPGDEKEYSLEICGVEIDIKLENRGRGGATIRLKRDVHNTIDNADSETQATIFWTLVHFARHIGIPGVSKELFEWVDGPYRIGGLYRYAGFVLLEREWNYRTYGERYITEYGESLEQFHGDEDSDEYIDEAEDRFGSYSVRGAHESNSHAQSILQAGDDNE